MASPTLDQLVYQFQRQLTFVVKINGVTLTPSSPLSDTGVPALKGLRIAKSFDNPVPTCELDVSHLPTWITRGQSVTVDLGYNGLTLRVFTGFVQDRSRKVAQATIRCLGMSWALHRTVQITSRDVTGLKAQTALQQVFAYVGITNYVIANSQFVMGTSGNSMILEKMTAAQMAQLLADVDGSRIYEINSGEVVVQPIEPVPGPTPVYSYKTNDQTLATIIDGSDREDPDFFRSQVVVTGATLNAVGSTPSSTITATATLANTGNFVQPPLPAGSQIGMEYSNHLIDTQAQANTLASLLLSRFGRIPRYLTVDIAGDPRVDLGMTIGLDFSQMGVGASNWFVYGVSHSIDLQNGWHTQLQLRGGDQLGGTVDINPVASFTFVSEQEVIGGRVLTVVGLDASTSFDPDGTIANPGGYVWTSNQPVTIPNGKRVTVSADTTGWVGPWTITLTVTDNSGNTGTLTQTIPYASTDTGITIPSLFSALNNNSSATPDGGQTWHDQAKSTCVSCGAAPPTGTQTGVGVYGFTDGSIWRTTDYCNSALVNVKAAAGADGTINCIGWNFINPVRVFAGTSTGRLYVSLDSGVTWTLYKDFGGGYPINKIALPDPDGVWVFGGRGDQTGTLVQFDAKVNGNWQSIGIGGQLAADLVGAGSAVTVADYCSAANGELALIFKGAALPGGVSIFYCPSDPSGGTDIFGSGAGWLRATGLDAGLTDGRFIVRDYAPGMLRAGFSNRNVWVASDGVTFTKNANVFPANAVPWKALWLGEALGMLPGVYLVALEDTVTPNNGYIGKSTDSFATEVALRPVSGSINTTWPASAKGKDLAIGASGNTIAASSGIATVGSGPAISFPTSGLGNWKTVTLPSSIVNTRPRPYVLGSKSPWFVADTQGGHPTLSPCNTIVRSSDGGNTWQSANVGDETRSAPIADGITVVCMSSDGTIYGARRRGSATSDPIVTDIYKSPDGGQTWGGAVYTRSVAGQARMPVAMVAHPTDAKTIYCFVYPQFTGGTDGQYETIISQDAGLTWAVHTQTSFANDADLGPHERFTVLPTGRIICQTGGTASQATSQIWTSDDNGSTWTRRVNDAGGQYVLAGRNPSGSKVVAFKMASAAANTNVYVSTDSGVTWTPLNVDATALNIATSTQGFESWYDSGNDTLYALNGGHIYALSPVSASGVWKDVTNAWPSAGVATSYASLIPLQGTE